MSVQTEITFSDRVLQSRLLDSDELERALTVLEGNEKALPSYLVREGLLTRFQARQLRAGATGFHVDKYVVVDCIGRGGNGVIFKARHTLLPNRYVALKTLNARDLHQADEALARFRREIDIVSRLEHPNIVRAYDQVRTRTQMYLVLEYVEGSDLGRIVRDRGPLPIAEAVDYTIQAARGLAYAHKCGVIHRDIKPGNLLLTRDYIVKLSDLGLARVYAAGTDADLTLNGGCIGTPEFMAPEQAEDAGRADVRSDLYSLGTTLFHLLTAELPVSGSSQMHRLQRLLTQPPKPLAEARPDAPTGLAAVVDRLRSRDPANRPASADEAIVMLEPYLRPALSSNGTAWDARSKTALVLEVLQGKLSAAEAIERHGISRDELEQWQQRFLAGAHQALDPSALPADASIAALRDLHEKIGIQAMEIEMLKKRLNIA